MNAKLLVLYISITFSYAATTKNNDLKLDEPCVNPSKKNGSCVPIDQCRALLKEKTNNNFIKKSECGKHNAVQLYCCPIMLPDPPVCGIDKFKPMFSNRIFGGTKTRIDQFRWSALIKYNRGDHGYSYNCGGSLINQRYVLSAAHCFKHNAFEPVAVRLGEYNLLEERDCASDNSSYCTEPIDVPIEKYHVHEDYDKMNPAQLHDIALVRLKDQVEFTDFIQPICLQKTQNMRELNIVNNIMFIVGWGRTENSSFSPEKLFTDVTLIDHSKCNEIYSKEMLSINQICGESSEGKDSCQGDSGGPAMIFDKNTWYLAGIVSIGPEQCATEGRPGVYTRVSQYIEWINQKIRK